MMQRLINKAFNTEQLDDYEYYYYQLKALKATVHSSSDGQFTGGFHTVIYTYEGTAYEFDFNPDDSIFNAVMYPTVFLRQTDYPLIEH